MDAEVETITITVKINGTNVNPWHIYGLRQNPFPQIGKAEYDLADQQINSLNGDPVKSADDIRTRLAVFNDEFIEGCVARFQPGERVSFEVTFPVAR